MLTNNFRKILNYMFKNETLLVKNNIVGLNGRIISYTDEDSIPLNFLNKSKPAILTSDSTKTEGVFIAYGNGTTIATSNDYNLESEITDLTLLGNSVFITDNGYVVTSSIKNTSNEDIIVKELGLFETSNGKDIYVARLTFMLTRNVLETPITIKPNETKTFTVTINF